MSGRAPEDGASRRARLDAEWRDPARVASHWQGADVPREALRARVRGAWWQTLAEVGGTLIVTREYEHFLVALRAGEDGPESSWFPLPHPSGTAVDVDRGVVYVAATRNPNQIFEFGPVTSMLPRADLEVQAPRGRPLVPLRSRFLPGSLYLHDLALIGGRLYGNAAGQDAVVELTDDGRWRRAWWPRCLDAAGIARFERNHLQLNSIAAGDDLDSSYFTASAEKPSSRRPGHLNFPVDRRGVLFSGATREPVARGLTRPHSARLHEGRVWVDDSGYGELVAIEPEVGKMETIARLPGWTRGLCFRRGVAFVGTSRVLPRFRAYAPGLDVDSSECGVHAVDVASGEVLGSLLWPLGDQIFSIDWLPSELATGLPFDARGGRTPRRDRSLFYAFDTDHTPAGNQDER